MTTTQDERDDDTREPSILPAEVIREAWALYKNPTAVRLHLRRLERQQERIYPTMLEVEE